MGIPILLTIVGILATVVLGLLTIRVGIRRRYPGQITFVLEEHVELFNSIVRNISELSLLYKAVPINEFVVLLKGHFVNTGSRDITRDMVVEPLKVVLPEGYTWLDGKVVSFSPNVHAEVSISDDVNLVFDLGLFRCDEHLGFEALAELPSEQSFTASTNGGTSPNLGEQLHDALEFSHRISDTQKIQKRVLPTESTPRRRRRLLIWTIPAVALLIISIVGLVATFFFDWPSEQVVHFGITAEDGNELEVEIIPTHDGNLKIKAVSNSFSRETTLDEFFAGCNCNPRVVPDSDNKSLRWMIVGYAALLSIVLLIQLIFVLFERRESTRLKTLLSQGA